jgi:hypothetical protein
LPIKKLFNTSKIDRSPFLAFLKPSRHIKALSQRETSTETALWLPALPGEFSLIHTSGIAPESASSSFTTNRNPIQAIPHEKDLLKIQTLEVGTSFFRLFSL